jgi:hypothetical protein
VPGSGGVQSAAGSFSASFRISVAGCRRCLNNVAFDAMEVSVA